MNKRHKTKSRGDAMDRQCARGSTVLISFHRPARVTSEEFVIFYSTCRKMLGQHPHCIIHKHPSIHIIRTFLQGTKHCGFKYKIMKQIKNQQIKEHITTEQSGGSF